MKKWTILAALVLVLSGVTVASAADSVMIHPDVNITVDIPKFGLVIPNTSPWSFILTSTDQDPDQKGIEFTASSFDYKLRVFSNTNVTVTLNDGRVNVGTEQSPVWFYPLYEWGSAKFWARDYTGPEPGDNAWTLYTSGAAVADHQIALTGFKIYVSPSATNPVHADPDDATSPTNPPITQFAPGNASGVLIVTVAATPSP